MIAEKMHFPKLSLRIFNNWLTLIVATAAIYIIAMPYLPQFDWWLKHDSPVKTIVRRPQPAPAVSSGASATPAPGQPAIEGNALFIPSLDMQEKVYGGGRGALSKGVWRLPHTSTPDKGSNTVLVGHRFTYTDPKGVFYHLDKTRKGDKITLRWQDKLYEYQVAEIKVVPPTEISVEAGTERPQLTIYTCTPLWNAKDRLVVVAKPVEAQ